MRYPHADTVPYLIALYQAIILALATNRKHSSTFSPIFILAIPLQLALSNVLQIKSGLS
jgi:hypothetical protein